MWPIYINQHKESLNNTVTTDMIKGGYKQQEKRKEVMDDSKYYVNNEDDDLPDLIPLRKFHNYIKLSL